MALGVLALPLHLQTIISHLQTMKKENVRDHQHLPPLLLVKLYRMVLVILLN